MRAFSAKETLDGDNRPECGRCHRRRKSTKSLAVHRFPPILAIHLKRFQYNSTSREKLTTAVDFPIAGLDLAPYSTSGACPSSDVHRRGSAVAGDPSGERLGRDLYSSAVLDGPECGRGTSRGNLDQHRGGEGEHRSNVGNRPAMPTLPVYELYAVCNHMGGLQGGHYTAHCRSRSSCGGSGEWHTFDDARVGPVKTARIGGMSAYVLFYRLMDPNGNR